MNKTLITPRFHTPLHTPVTPLRLLLTAIAVLSLCACSRVKTDGGIIDMGNGTVYAGCTDTQGRPHGYGQLTKGDSTLYEGQWSHGKRTGRGVVTDSIGRRIVGTWRADTITRGTRTDSHRNVYSGDFNRHLMAQGYGTARDSAGTVYTGQWRKDQRAGWGFALEARKHIRVGEWKADRYLGERLN